MLTRAVAFAGVVILTMLAAESFDPRLMWDAAGEQALIDVDQHMAAELADDLDDHLPGGRPMHA